MEMQGIRVFDSGATRDSEDGKLDFEGFLSPAVLRRYAQYMHEHRQQSDGSLRASDNWQRGIPKSAYMKSLLRHVMELWGIYRWEVQFVNHLPKTIEDTLCAVMFNTMGLLHELLLDAEFDGAVDRG